MKGTPLPVCTGLLLFISLISPAAAQTKPEGDSSPKFTGSANDLRIMPRLGVGYNTSGAGYDGFTRFEGFVPLLQNPGTSLTFLEGRLLLDNSAHLGGNLLLGHRFYNSNLNRTFGGYLSYDNRNTGNSTFNQLGFGVESLGRVWDFRANAYLPLGNSRKLVGETGFDTGLQTTGSPFFQGNYLITQAIRESQQIRNYEAALGGFDIEAGTRIAKLGSNGDLRGYGGLYYYGGNGSDSSLGWRLRLEARPTDSLNLGLAVQDDKIFGTNVLFSVGLTFPGTRPKKFINDSDSVVARLGESVSRTNSIAVDSQTEAKSFSQQVTVTATNPQTNAPYVFQHVNSGKTGGDGTIENPFSSVETALGVTQGDGNSIVYVNADASSSAISGFQIRDGVQVLSSGTVQEIATKEFGLVRLPGSGNGSKPNVTGAVTLGNNTVLSGFAIASTNSPAIEARNISNAVIRDNTITSTAQTGVRLENVTGTVSLNNNTIISNGGAALEASNINNASITQSTLTSTNSATSGIAVNGVTGTLDVNNSTVSVTNPTANGISATNISGTVNLAANSGSQISTNSTAASISVQQSTGSVNLSGLQASSTGGAVLEATNINNASITQSTLTSTNSATNGITLNGVNGTVDVNNSTVSVINPTANGISATNISGTVNLAANTGSEITTNSTAASISLQESTGSVNLSGLQVSSTGGAVLEATNINNASITQSTLTSSNSATNGITLNGVNGTVDVNNSTVSVTNPTANGILATNITGTVNFAANSGSQISNAGSDGVRLEQITGGLTLSGFEIADSVNNGVAAVNSRNLTIQGNTIGNSGIDGISLNNVTGKTTITNNQITNSVEDAIGLTNTTGQTELTITQNQLDTNGKGINLSIGGDAQATAQIANNQILNSSTEALLINLLENGQFNATVSNNQVTNAGTTPGNNGVSLVTRGNTASTFTFSNNSFTNIGNNYGFYLDTGGNSSSNFISSNNQLTSGTGVIGGIVLENNAPTSQLCVQLNGNTSSGAGFVDYALSNNASSLYQIVDLLNTTINNTGNLQFFSGPFTNVQVCPAP